MDTGLTAAVFGLVGALIGSASSVATIIVQSRYRDKRDRSKQILDLSLAEYGAHLDLLKAGKVGGAIFPITTYVHNNSLLVQALDEGNLNPQRIAAIMSENREFNRVVKDADDSRRKISN